MTIVFPYKIVYNIEKDFSRTFYKNGDKIMNMNFYAPVNIITGKNCVKENAKLFANYGKKCLIVTGKTSAKKCGALDDVLSALESVDVTCEIFDGIEQNPTYESCLKASEAAKAFGAEFIIGIGGGSPLDAAKAVAVLSAVTDTSAKALYSMEWDAEPLPVIAIGTTAGTGSEVTPVAVITTPEGMKKSFKSPASFPRIAFGDASYTMSLSADFTRSTALDALAHSTEAYFNKFTNDICRTYALRSIEILLKMLEKTAKCDEIPLSFEDREKLYCASIYAGLAISVAGTCFPHGMGYFLSEQYGIAHGNACAIYLEDFINYNTEVAPDEAKAFFNKLKTGKETLLSLIKANLPEINLTLSREKINELLPRYENNKNFNKCYGSIGKDFAEKVLTRLFLK